VEFPDWWFNIRPSNTEPLMRLVVEASEKKLLDRMVKEIEAVIGPVSGR
jgi:phosphomannomutase